MHQDPMKSKRPRSPWLLIPLAFSAACAQDKPAETPAPTYQIDNSEDPTSRSGVGMMAEIGGLNEEKVAKTFKRLQPEFTSCLMAGLKRVEFLAGEVQFLVHVDLEGQVADAFIEHSSLGDFDTEACMIERIRATKWPKPVGGRIGLARSGLAFETPPDARPPVMWTGDDVASTLSRNQSTLGSCGGSGPFEITAYVAKDGSVMSAGIAHSTAADSTAAACYLEKIKELKFPSPGSWPAKVTFKR
jgi:hypothetical protein